MILSLRAAGCCLAALFCLLATSPAVASRAQESTFQDDDLLLHDGAASTAQTLDQLQMLGVDRVRISVTWATLAPNADSRVRPAFDASDPAAYAASAWEPYDRAIEMAQARGMGVNLDLAPPSPHWATGVPPRPDVADTYEPSAEEFGQFVTAVGRRYSGTYSDPRTPGQLPRVDYWSIWNEPNNPGRLTPQWTPGPGGPVESSPAIYRGLVDGAYGALAGSGHAGDTIVVGELSPEGFGGRGATSEMKPLRFLRRLYCLDDNYRVLGGAAAAARGCPGSVGAFAAAHPGLLRASGFAVHPYELNFPPHYRLADRDFAVIGNLAQIKRALARALAPYGRRMSLYLTEFGYETNPPNAAGVSFAQQAAYLNEAEFIAYSDPTVATLTQFLLADDHPAQVGLVGSTFQTGLITLEGLHKPAFNDYALPIFLPRATTSRRRRLRVWGMVRPDRGHRIERVAIQWSRRAHGRGFHTIAKVRTQAARGYVDVRVRVRSSGYVRLAWRRPGDGTLFVSRAVRVRVRG